jgi:hypothetical protein
MTIMPKSRLGKWTFGLATTFVVLLLVSGAAFVAISLSPVEPSRIWLIILITDASAMLLFGMGAFITGLFGIKNNQEHSVLIYSSLTLTLIGIIFLGVFAWGSPKHVSDEELIKRVIAEPGDLRPRCEIVNPLMSLYDVPDSISYVSVGSESYIRDSFQQQGLGNLVDSLFAKNAQPQLMGIPSAPENGYLIDYDGKYEGYSTIISIPVYDAKTGLVMVYRAFVFPDLPSGGGIYVYKYIFGRLIPINYLALWMS